MKENLEKPENQDEKEGVEKFTEQEIPGDLKEKLGRLRNHGDDNIFFEINDKIGKFADQLKKKYEDFEDHLFFHLLAGSSLREACGKYDFPGEDSVERFIDDLYGRYIKETSQ